MKYLHPNKSRLDFRMGFSDVAITISIAVVLIALGGAFWVLWQDTQSLRPTKTKSSSERKSLVPQQVVLLVAKNLEGQVDKELETYSQDLAREYEFKTLIRYVLPSEDVLTLRSYITEIYSKGGLQGVLLIGDVPTGKFARSDELDEEQFALSDSIYQDIFNECFYLLAKKAFSAENYECRPVAINPFWVARLTPNSSSKTSVALLKDYFRRNHEHRTGQRTFKKKALLYYPALLDQTLYEGQRLLYNNKEELLSKVGNSAKFLDLYRPGEYYLIDNENSESDQVYLKELRKPYEYEVLFYNGHGLPTLHDRNLSSEHITNTSFFYADFKSCSVGRFTTKDYLVGQYLFSGGLVAVGASLPIFVLETPTTQAANFMLAIGEPVYEALKVSGTHFQANIFGDPTLRMRYRERPAKYQAADPVMELSHTSFAFSAEQPKVDIKISNKGSSVLKFWPKFEFYRNKSLHAFTFISHYTSAPIKYDDTGVSYLNPGEEGMLTIDISSLFSSLGAGTYNGETTILSNDPLKPYQIVPFEIKKD